MSMALRQLVRPASAVPASWSATSSVVSLRARYISASPRRLEAAKDSAGENADNAVLERLKDELKAAMKGKDTHVASTIRSILSEYQYAAKASAAGAAGSGILTLIQKAIAKRKDSAAQYVEAKRQDLADKEHSEASILERFLPAQMNEGEIKAAIDEAIAKVKKTAEGDGKRLLGAVIKEVKTAVGEGRIDGKTLKEAVEKAMK
ncbi:unnamed protein product [Parajaminaea phylloscopi]